MLALKVTSIPKLLTNISQMTCLSKTFTLKSNLLQPPTCSPPLSASNSEQVGHEWRPKWGCQTPVDWFLKQFSNVKTSISYIQMLSNIKRCLEFISNTWSWTSLLAENSSDTRIKVMTGVMILWLKTLSLSFIHSFILNIYVAPLQESYSEAFVTPAQLKEQF